MNRRSALLKGTIMIVFLVLLTVTAVAAIAGALALTVTDGYGRTPRRAFPRTV